MNDIAKESVAPMQNPPHLGELIHESMDEMSWNVTATATHPGCKRGTLSRLLNGKAGVSAHAARCELHKNENPGRRRGFR